MLIVASKTSCHCTIRYESAEFKVKLVSVKHRKERVSFETHGQNNVNVTLYPAKIESILTLQKWPTSAFGFNCTSLWFSLCLSRSPSSHSLFLSVCAPLSLLPVSLIRNPVKIAQAKQGGFDQALISTEDSVSAHPDSTEPWSPGRGAPDGSLPTPRHHELRDPTQHTINEIVPFPIGFLQHKESKSDLT